MGNPYHDMVLTNQDLQDDVHRAAVGGFWDEIGHMQFDWLFDSGMRREHTLLDVGCGSLRAGVHLIEYLEPGHYYGIDINESLMQGAQLEINRYKLQNKLPNLLVNGLFEFNLFHTKFDYMIAQSVFTHMPLNDIHRCLINADAVLADDGKFYATFFETETRHQIQAYQHAEVTSYIDHDPYHYHISDIEHLIEGLSLKLEYIGDWKHPRNQKMLMFYK